MNRYKPKGFEFFDNALGKPMILIEGDRADLNGWLAYQNHDGQWATYRLATDDDLKKIDQLRRHGDTSYILIK